MTENLTPRFGKYYLWCCPNRDSSTVEPIDPSVRPATEGRQRRRETE